MIQKSHYNYRGFWIRNSSKFRKNVDKFYQSFAYLLDEDSLSSIYMSPVEVLGNNLHLSYNIANIDGFLENTQSTFYLSQLNQFETKIIPFLSVRELICYITNNLSDSDSDLIVSQLIANLFFEQIKNIDECCTEERETNINVFTKFLIFTYDIWEKWNKFKKAVEIKMLELCRHGIYDGFLVLRLLNPKLCCKEIQPYCKNMIKVKSYSTNFNDFRYRSLVEDFTQILWRL